MPNRPAASGDGHDPAATFAFVARRLRTAPDRPSRLALSRWRGDSAVKLQTTKLTERILFTGHVNPDQLELALSGPREAFVLLRALDRAFANLDPYAGTRHHGRLGHYRRVYRRLGRYNEDASMGAVIPRRSFPTRPQHVPDHEAEYFRHLMVVPRVESHIQFFLLEPELDFPDTVRSEETIVVGCAPFLGALDELDLRRIEDTENWYAIRARTGDLRWERVWRTRIDTVLAELDRSAHVGLLPELALTDELLTWWVDAVQTTPRPENSILEWIVAGTGPLTGDVPPEQPPNRAVLLHRLTGRVILEQDKCEPFTLTDDHLRNWGLDALGTGPLAEWMHEGTIRWVVDARVGRLSILVCEDHSRLLTVGAELASLAPTLLLVPIFAPPILRHRWQQKSAEQFANTTGSASVVATSDAVPLPKNENRNVAAGTALALMPTQRGPSSGWSAVTLLEDGRGNPTSVVTFTLPRC